MIQHWWLTILTLFNDAQNIRRQMRWENDHEGRVLMDLERGSHSLSAVIILGFTRTDWGVAQKPSVILTTQVMLAGLWSEIQTQDFFYVSQES
jgi:hypothetical protein